RRRTDAPQAFRLGLARLARATGAAQTLRASGDFVQDRTVSSCGHGMLLGDVCPGDWRSPVCDCIFFRAADNTKLQDSGAMVGER
ncbi:MAG: hypothetical protein D6744_08030, partial [Planctomycetota bacterium]